MTVQYLGFYPFTCAGRTLAALVLIDEGRRSKTSYILRACHTVEREREVGGREKEREWGERKGVGRESELDRQTDSDAERQRQRETHRERRRER